MEIHISLAEKDFFEANETRKQFTNYLPVGTRIVFHCIGCPALTMDSIGENANDSYIKITESFIIENKPK